MKTAPHTRFKDFLHRPDAYDDYIIREQGSYHQLNIQSKESVLDVGAHIGAFARWAIEQGAGQLTCIEPEPENLELLRKNTQGLKVRRLAGAAVGTTDTQVDLFINVKKNKGLHAIDYRRGREAIRVSAFRFSNLLKKYRPAVLKIDIEGGEYGLDWSAALGSWRPRAIGVELHLTRRHWRLEQAQELMNIIREHGYTGGTNIPATSWTALAFFERV